MLLNLTGSLCSVPAAGEGGGGVHLCNRQQREVAAAGSLWPATGVHCQPTAALVRSCGNYRKLSFSLKRNTIQPSHARRKLTIIQGLHGTGKEDRFLDCLSPWKNNGTFLTILYPSTLDYSQKSTEKLHI